ncbi:MAG TPA: hypothetical protein VFV09_13550 [Actinomycetota bacterium]|jgi:hypothetical protein|nr:hypothetical protein [Actinomycetota bacterium]
MLKTKKVTIQEIKAQLANRIAEYDIPSGVGSAGTVEISLAQGVTRTFRAHWTGFRLTYQRPTLVLKASLKDGSFWSEGYISPDQPSFVLVFRKKPHKSRGTGAERPDDKFSSAQALETSRSITAARVEEGVVADEEIIRYEDFDDPFEAVDEFFNYTSFYGLRAVDLELSQFGFVADESVRWEDQAIDYKATPDLAKIEEGLKRSDILWLSVDTDPGGKPVPCWFLYTKDKRLFILSGEPEQRIPFAGQVKKAHVQTRWKGRDATMVDFDARVRPITAADGDEFREVAQLLVAKRQSVRGSAADTIDAWMRDAVILELFPGG